MELIIATRKSKLAQVQTEKVMELLKGKENVDSKKLLVMTEGDRRLDVSLNKIGGKGLFVKEIELALLNKEAHGGPTDLPWGIMVDGVKVHPTFLYESIWDLGVFIFLMLFRKKQKYEGQILVYYITLYSIGRFFIEGLRTDSLMLGPLRMAQVISLGFILIGVILNYVLSKKNKR